MEINTKIIIKGEPKTEQGTESNRKKLLQELPRKRKIKGFISINLKFSVYIHNNKTKKDLDNMIKFILDKMVDKKYIEDDSMILKIQAEKIHVFEEEESQTEIEIIPIYKQNLNYKMNNRAKAIGPSNKAKQ